MYPANTPSAHRVVWLANLEARVAGDRGREGPHSLVAKMPSRVAIPG